MAKVPRESPCLDQRHALHRVVFQIQRVDLAPLGQSRGSEDRIVRIDPMARIPFPEQPSGLINDRLIDRSGPNPGKQSHRLFLFVRPHEEQYLRTLHRPGPQLDVGIFRQLDQLLPGFLFSPQVPNQEIGVEQHSHGRCLSKD